jgi:hypothetical protein
MHKDQDNNKSVKELLNKLKDRVHLSFPMISAYAEEMLSEEGMSKAGEHIMQCRQCRDVYEDIKKEIEETDKPGFSEQDATVPEMSDKLRAKVNFAAKINLKRDEITEKVAKNLIPQDFWPRISFIISSVRNSSEEGAIEYSSTLSKADYSIAAFDSGEDAEYDNVYDTVKQAVSVVDMFLNLLLDKCNSPYDVEECCRSCSAELLELFDENNTESHIFNLVQEAAIESLSKEEK